MSNLEHLREVFAEADRKAKRDRVLAWVTLGFAIATFALFAFSVYALTLP